MRTAIHSAARALTLAAILATSACTTMSPAEEAAMRAEAERPVTCLGAADCRLKWGRALQWVLANSEYKIANQTDLLISTLGPLPDDPSPAFTVSRTPVPGGGYVFELRMGCDNIFGCQPSLLSLQASFVRSVMGPAP